MPYFRPADRELALQRLEANRWDVARTAAELGIHPSTLYKWRKAANFANSISSFSSPISPIADSPVASPPPHFVGRGLGGGDNLPPDDLQALRDLKSQMLREAEYISVNIRSAVNDAPLSQRVAALAQLIDRIIKLAAQLPAYDENELLEELLDEGEAEDEEEEEDFSDTPYRPESDY